MDWLLEWLKGFVASPNHPGGLAALAAAATLEYVFPPFPGDTVILFGAMLITAYDWSFPLFFGVVMAGSCAGAMVDFYLGTRLASRRQRQGREDGTLGRLVARFQRYGAVYLVLNRFFPGIRALFFVAAGLARMRPGAVLFYSAISAGLWSLLLVGVGASIGANLDDLARWIAQYTILVWMIIGGVVLVAGVRWWWRKPRTPT